MMFDTLRFAQNGKVKVFMKLSPHELGDEWQEKEETGLAMIKERTEKQE